MARNEIITYTYTDDLTGETVAEEDFQTVEFSYGGDHYSIDLGTENAKALDDFLAPYIAKAKRQYTKYYASPKKATRKAVSRPGIREWARENGYKVSDRGRIDTKIQEAYDAAH